MASSEPNRDHCYALHDFVAENPDELSFSAGELIVILERDDQYGDGWYQGRNAAGDVGLFPQSYTSSTPPSPTTPSSQGPSPIDPVAVGVISHTPEPILPADKNESERSLGGLEVGDTSRGGDGASIRSARSGISQSGAGHSDDDEPGPVLNPRAILAAKAAENAEREKREEKERADRRRQQDEENYARTRSENGLVEGLQLSDESDDEEEPVGDGLSVPMAKSTSRSSSKQPSISSVAGSPLPEAALELHDEPEPVEVLSSPTVNGDGDEFPGRPRSPSAASSTYAESTYSAGSPAPVHLNAPILNSTPSPSLDRPASPSPQPTNGDTEPEDLTSSKAAEALAAVGAGVAGAATVAAAAVVNGASSVGDAPSPKLVQDEVERAPSPLPLPEEAQAVAAPPEAEVVRAAPTNVVEPSPALSVGSPSALSNDTPTNGLTPVRSLTPTIPVTPTLPSAAVQNVIQSTERTASPAASLTSADHSRASSRLDTAPLTAASTGTGETSLRDSTSGATKSLPYDPTLWGVDEVVEWGKSKGFDALTLGKFQEHEISGDVLLEMDVAMLKEIDLTAFGRRVHIYNAIKELKARLAPPPAAVMSPSSGYIPDSPGTSMSFASPSAMSFASASRPLSPAGSYPINHYPSSSFGGSEADDSSRRISDPAAGGLNGLGLAENSSVHLQKPPPGIHARTGPKPSRSHQGAQGISRSSTMDTFETGTSASNTNEVENPILEEKEDDESLAAAMAVGAAATGAGAAVAASSSPKTTSPVIPVRVPRPPKSSNGSETMSPNARARKTASTFFDATFGRARKPPPRVPSAVALNEGRTQPEPRTKRNALASSTSSRRSTRLFGAFSGGSGSEKSASVDSYGHSRRNLSTSQSSAREAPSSMTLKEVDAAPAAMMAAKTEAVTSGNLLDKIGTPDYSGWMQKKGEKYNTWKQRFFILKGIHLYYLKSESEQRVKGFINLTGYRVLADADIHPGQYGFKIVHDVDRAHYFSAAEQVTVRTWMKEIMKATIGRDYSAAVVSSCNIETMPLAIAQTMTPRPRPPSPASRARVQKEKYAGANPNTLSPKDAMILMEFSSSPLMGGSTSPSLGASTNGKSPMSRSTTFNSVAELAKTSSPVATPPIAATPVPAAAPAPAPEPSLDNGDLLGFVNSHLPVGTPQAANLGDSLRSGEILVRLVEDLSGKSSGITSEQFASYRPPGEGQFFDAAYFDVVFAVFDFLSPIVSTEDVSMDDMLSGNEPRLVLLLERIRAAFPEKA
ncbi:hypothetical protein MNV49_007705 [Pseudohyphozyma bogoriensis]|nr:hypothetical protein MNV49_007705 [Pseudohyphozyma bogoriensis]